MRCKERKLTRSVPFLLPSSSVYAEKSEMETTPEAKVYNCSQRAHGSEHISLFLSLLAFIKPSFASS
jgi:hypothetical protein